MGTEKLVKIGLQPWIYENPQKYEAFWFEKVDGNELRFWTRQQLPYCVAICCVYSIFVWFGPHLMKQRKAFNLQFPLFIWNALLAIFSIFGAARVLPELFEVIGRPNGFHRSFCFADYVHYPETFWGFAFNLSKIVELGDTVFIVLRKKPLSFLHWFHHMTMVWMTFYIYSEGEPFCRYVASINFSVHAIMYSYYAIRALNIRVPKWISIALTGIQIMQFIADLFVNAYTFNTLANGGECFRTTNSIKISSFVIGTYLILFLKFFYNTYIATPKVKLE